MLLDGRASLQGAPGNFIAPTILTGIDSSNPLTSTEIFGPVLTVNESNTLEDAIEAISRSSFGNSAAIFTSSGSAARKFRYEVPAGNIGVNIGVAAPMAYFPFSGWKDSFIERWPKEWSRKF
jgi:malonate-semialdehyde dehydrogenase (acetylating)/methylmalonate-semialdehyde dehydrogenase